MDKPHFDYKLSDWYINIEACLLFDEQKTIHIEPKNMEVLAVLIRANGKLVSRDTLMQEVWEGRYVTEYALNSTIAALRKHLDPLNKNSYIVTRPKRGYQLVCSMTKYTLEQSLSEADSKQNAFVSSPNTHSSHSNTKVKYRQAIVSVLVLIPLIVIGSYWFNQNQNSNKALQIEDNPILIAVLPFSYDALKPELSYFATGFSSELITQFQSIAGMSALDKRSTFPMARETRDANVIGQKLGANYILDGKVFSTNEALLSLDIQLKDKVGQVLWQGVLQIDANNVFASQDTITDEVIKAIDSTLSINSSQGNYYRSVNGEAFMQLLKGRAKNGEATLQAYQDAITHFKLAIELDRSYAMAYVDLAVNYLVLYGQGNLSLSDANLSAMPLLEKALVLEPKMPSAIAAQAIFALYNNRNDESLRLFNEALQLNPHLYLARLNLAFLYKRQGSWEQSLRHYLLAKKLAPLSRVANWAIGRVSFELGSLNYAIQQLESCTLFVSAYTNCHLELAFIQRMLLQHKEADDTFASMQNMVKNSDDFYIKLNSAFHAWWKKDLPKALSVYEELYTLQGSDYEYLDNLAMLHWQLGSDATFLERVKANTDLSNAKKHHLSALGLLAYAKRDCEQSLFYYEQAFGNGIPATEGLIELAEGYTHDLNMAACYTLLGKKEIAMLRVKNTLNILREADESAKSMQSVKFAVIKAIEIAAQNEQPIDFNVQEISADYPHYWLLTHDWAINNMGSVTP